MQAELVTERLSLRRGLPGDFEAIHDIYARPEVARMVASWPIPADPGRTRRVCAPMPADEGIAGPMLLGDTIIGNMGCHRSDDGAFVMGYGLHPDHWGRGYATEMGRAMIDAVFARYDIDVIKAGTWADNPASVRVLEKLGMRFVRLGLGWCAARGQALDALMHEITRGEWLAANPLDLTTGRLTIRGYRAADMPALHAIATRPDVARMILSFAPDDTLEKVANWALARRYRGRPGFCAGVFLADGTLIGNVGLAPGATSTMYFYDPAHWRQGYATEAHRALLAWAFPSFGLDAVEADHFHDNPASGRVLEKLGFRRTGEGRQTSAGRLEPDRVILYRLTRGSFGAST